MAVGECGCLFIKQWAGSKRGRVEARQGYALKAPPPAIHFFQWFTWFLSIQACKRSEYYWIALRQAELPRRG